MLISPPLLPTCQCGVSRCLVPPAPELQALLYAEYLTLRERQLLPDTVSFRSYYSIWRSKRRSERVLGLDDGSTILSDRLDSNMAMIDRPPVVLRGTIRTLVLLVDFPDKPHESRFTPDYYQKMLFGTPGTFPGGSMRDYYRLISNYNASSGEGIDVQGEVYGWFTLPQPSSYYADNNSGMGVYPRNVQKMAEDAIAAALARHIKIDSAYDALGTGLVTALFIIHAGRGAEITGSRADIWSLKWGTNTRLNVGSLDVQTFLTVPEDCQVGVCAHEWGHLAARWADYYDTGSDKGRKSNGLANYCLMAAGSWGDGGKTPTFPNGMLRMFHGWIRPDVVTASQKNLTLKPAAEGGSVVVIQHSKYMKPEQYVLVEYRRRKGQDAYLPDEGIAIYVVDESIPNVDIEERLAIKLLQADGKNDLAQTFVMNRGDVTDLYPEGTNRKAGKGTKPALNLPPEKDKTDEKWSGVTITVNGTPGANEMSIDIELAP